MLFRSTDPSKKWTVVPGDYPPTVRDALASIHGIHLDRELERFYPHGDLARGVLGTVLDGKGLGGVEQRYEEVLRGKPGKEVAAREDVAADGPAPMPVLPNPLASGLRAALGHDASRVDLVRLRRGGRIVIHYADDSQLGRIYARLATPILDDEVNPTAEE
mgnify:CR=1 FL=1